MLLRLRVGETLAELGPQLATGHDAVHEHLGGELVDIDVLGVLIASAVVDASDFGSQEAWFYVSLLTIGYMISRGLAKSGSRDFYDDNVDDNHAGR